MYADNWMLPQLDVYTRKTSQLLDKILVTFVPISFMCVFFAPCHLFFQPMSKMYVTSLFSEQWLNTHQVLQLVILLPIIILYLFACIGIVTVYILHFQIVLTYIFFLTPILWKDLRLNLPSYRTAAELRSKINLTHEYRSIEIIHAMAVENYGPLILPFHTVFMLIAIFTSYVATRYWTVLNVTFISVLAFLAFVTVIFWAIVLIFGGFYFTQCTRTIKSWKHFEGCKEDILYIKLFARSCKALKIGDQSRFKINNLSLLFFIKGVTRGIMRALLTLR